MTTRKRLGPTKAEMREMNKRQRSTMLEFYRVAAGAADFAPCDGAEVGAHEPLTDGEGFAWPVTEGRGKQKRLLATIRSTRGRGIATISVEFRR